MNVSLFVLALALITLAAALFDLASTLVGLDSDMWEWEREWDQHGIPFEEAGNVC